MFVRLRGGTAGGEADDEGDEFDGDGRVGVVVRVERAGDVDGDAEFLLEFAVEGGFGGFAGFDFAAGEFPFSAEVFVRGALGHEDMALAFDEGADDAEGKRAIGHTDFYLESRKSGTEPAGQTGNRIGFFSRFPDFHIQLRGIGSFPTWPSPQPMIRVRLSPR